MAIDLSDEQRHSLETGSAVEIQDGPRTYYVITSEQFQKLRMLADVELADPSLYEAGEIELFDD